METRQGQCVHITWRVFEKLLWRRLRSDDVLGDCIQTVQDFNLFRNSVIISQRSLRERGGAVACYRRLQARGGG